MAKEFLSSGITEKTPGNTLFGAGTIHKGLAYGTYYVRTQDTEKQSGKTYYEQKGGSQGSVSYEETTDESLIPGKPYYEKYTGWNGIQTIIGATSGGTKLTIKPEFSDIKL